MSIFCHISQNAKQTALRRNGMFEEWLYNPVRRDTLSVSIEGRIVEKYRLEGMDLLPRRTTPINYGPLILCTKDGDNAIGPTNANGAEAITILNRARSQQSGSGILYKHNHISTRRHHHTRPVLTPVSPATADCATGPKMQPKGPNPTSSSPTGCRKDSVASRGSSASPRAPVTQSDDVSRFPLAQPQSPAKPHPRLRRKQGLAIMNGSQMRNALSREEAVVGSSEYHNRPLPSLPSSRPPASTRGAERTWRSTTEEQEVLEELADEFVGRAK
ncbi:hypothetical protein LX32DRAFT_657212 [Colletotrichum zoysiae]|uniref:Uncharacterized protein n=1 Tax=Colletotrichum zoysiae TaxID=1216348 RepID=A0AAD9H7Q2_9PEZI|nr:hypothetical protein LX32DRAFT_657212 [Colletotrichum zoysiae]